MSEHPLTPAERRADARSKERWRKTRAEGHLQVARSKLDWLLGFVSTIQDDETREALSEHLERIKVEIAAAADIYAGRADEEET